MAELREEVTWARTAAIMAGAYAAQVKRMAQERIVLLATTHGEADEVAQKVSALEGELVAVRQAQDTSKEKFLSLAGKAAAAE
jgi:hypothetical protein